MILFHAKLSYSALSFMYSSVRDFLPLVHLIRRTDLRLDRASGFQAGRGPEARGLESFSHAWAWVGARYVQAFCRLSPLFELLRAAHGCFEASSLAMIWPGAESFCRVRHPKSHLMRLNSIRCSFSGFNACAASCREGNSDPCGSEAG